MEPLCVCVRAQSEHGIVLGWLPYPDLNFRARPLSLACVSRITLFFAGKNFLGTFAITV